VLHGRRRARVGSGLRIRKVRRGSHCTILVVRRDVVGRSGAVGCHVAGRVHGLADAVVVVSVARIGLAVVRSLSTAATTARAWAYVCDTSLHRLPSRQMSTIVHHAGLGSSVRMR